MKTLTFADTLHPETAEVYVDSQNSSTTVWGTVMNEARTDLPVAVPVEHVRQDEEMRPGTDTKISGEVHDENAEMPVGGGCFYLEGLLGCSLTLVAVLATFAVELAAAICYSLAASMYYAVSGKDVPIFVKAIVMLIVHSLMVADAILLAVNLMLTEILGWVTGVVTSIFNPKCCEGGQVWHCYIRKVCHLVRWAFRGFHEGWKLQRKFPRLEFGDAEGHNEDIHNSSKDDIIPTATLEVSHEIEAPCEYDDPRREKEARKTREY